MNPNIVSEIQSQVEIKELRGSRWRFVKFLSMGVFFFEGKGAKQKKLHLPKKVGTKQ